MGCESNIRSESVVTSANSDPATGVLGKAAQLLDLLADRGETTSNELAKLRGEPRSSTYRLLRHLQELGYVEPGYARGTYRLGMKLFRLGSAAVGRSDVRGAALEVMRSIYDQTEETLFLCVRRGYEAVCIERIDGRWTRAMALELGGALPLHIGAAPRVLLAYEPPAFWDDYFGRGPLEALTPETPTDPELLLFELGKIRHRGFEISDHDVIIGVSAIGVPVFDHTGTIAASLSISGPQPAILGANRGHVTELMTEGGEAISRRLGFNRATS